MVHVQDMLEDYAGIDEDSFDERVSDTTLTLDMGVNLTQDIDFSNLDNIERIDLTQNGEHHLENLSLDDVLDITDESNTLEIVGDANEDTVSSVDTTGWVKDDEHTDSDSGDGLNEYVYTSDSGDSLTIKIDENIDNTGL